MLLRLTILTALFIGFVNANTYGQKNNPTKDPYKVGVYYFPNYHIDPYNEAQHGKGWTEWELMKHATPRFEGHKQPKVPLWGYENEAKPAVMEKKIRVAKKHGVDFFIFDWYYYDNHEFLNTALDSGYFNAKNNSHVPFCLMWANHDWRKLMPVKVNDKPDIIWDGDVSAEEFDAMMDLIIDKYFTHPAYYTINERPYFSIFSVKTFLRGFEGIKEAANAIENFRKKTKAAGFDGLHLNIVGRGGAFSVNNTEKDIRDFQEIVEELNAQSINTYNMVADKSTDNWPKVEYSDALESGEKFWYSISESFKIPYYPTISVGWDCSPRTVQSDRFKNVGYPFSPIYVNNTPDVFKEGLKRMKGFMDNRKPKHNICIINAWNEWTEGSYLEPDTTNKYQYLKSLQDVFGKE